MENVTNKKVEGLRRRRETWVKGGAEAEDGAKWYYEHQVRIIDYDIEDAVKAEAKRRVRLALKHIEKRLAEVDELRGLVNAVLYDDMLAYSERIEFVDELEKAFDFGRLVHGKR